MNTYNVDKRYYKFSDATDLNVAVIRKTDESCELLPLNLNRDPHRNGYNVEEARQMIEILQDYIQYQTARGWNGVSKKEPSVRNVSTVPAELATRGNRKEQTLLF